MDGAVAQEWEDDRFDLSVVDCKHGDWPVIAGHGVSTLITNDSRSICGRGRKGAFGANLRGDQAPAQGGAEA